MKHLFKKIPIVFALILVSFLYFSCTQERDYVNKKNRPKFNLQQKSFKEALAMPVFNTAYSKLAKKSIDSRAIESARTVLEDQFGFTIVTEEPVRIITYENGTVFYTLLIEREVKEELVFENLMIKVEDEQTAAVILKYTMDQKGTITPTGEYTMNDITSTLYTDLNVEGRIFFNSDGDTCFDINVVRCNIADHRPAGHIATQTCWDEFNLNPFGGSIYNSTAVICINDETGGTSGTNGGTGGTNGESSNNTGGLGSSGANTNPTTLLPIPCKTGNCIEANDIIKTPCQALLDLYEPTKTKILPAITLINNESIGFEGEKGAYFTKTGSVYDLPHYLNTGSSNASSYSINIPSGPTIYAAIHSHPTDLGDNPAAPMFSFADLEVLYFLYKKTNPENIPDVTFMLLLPNGSIYAIKVDNINQLQSYINSYGIIESVMTAPNKKVEKNIVFNNRTKNGANYGDSDMENKYIRGFIDEMKEHGVSLYRQTTATNPINSSIINGWEKLEPPINPNDALIKITNCN